MSVSRTLLEPALCTQPSFPRPSVLTALTVSIYLDTRGLRMHSELVSPLPRMSPELSQNNLCSRTGPVSASAVLHALGTPPRAAFAALSRETQEASGLPAPSSISFEPSECLSHVSCTFDVPLGICHVC